MSLSRLQIPYLTTIKRLEIIPNAKDLILDTTQYKLYVGDGLTLGGLPISEDNGLTGITRDITLTGNGIDEPLGVNSDLLLPETPENPSTKFLNGNKSWATVPIGAGGFSAPLYFSNEDSDVLGYKKISYANDETLTELSGVISNEELLLRTYLYDEALATTVIDAGLWVSSFRVKVSKIAGVTQLKFEVFVRHSDNTETTLFSDYSQELNNLDYVIIRKDSPQPVFSVATTDRLGVRIYGKTTSTAAITIYTTIGDGDASYFTTPIPFRHNLLRGLDYENSGHTGFEPAKGDDNNYVTDVEKIKLSNLSGTNTGDQDLSGLQEKLVSGENIKTLNNQSLLGGGNIEITAIADDDTLTGAGTIADPFRISDEMKRRINAGI